MRSLLLAALAFLSLASSEAQTTGSDWARQAALDLERADELALDRNDDAALALVRAALARPRPTDAEAAFRAGELWLFIANYEPSRSVREHAFDEALNAVGYPGPEAAAFAAHRLPVFTQLQVLGENPALARRASAVGVEIMRRHVLPRLTPDPRLVELSRLQVAIGEARTRGHDAAWRRLQRQSDRFAPTNYFSAVLQRSRAPWQDSPEQLRDEWLDGHRSVDKLVHAGALDAVAEELSLRTELCNTTVRKLDCDMWSNVALSELVLRAPTAADTRRLLQARADDGVRFRGQWHPDNVGSFFLVGQVATNAGDVSQARAALGKALAIAEHVVDAGGPLPTMRVLSVWSPLTTSLALFDAHVAAESAAGNAGAARDNLRRILDKCIGGDFENELTLRSALARALFRSGDMAGASELLEEARARYRQRPTGLSDPRYRTLGDVLDRIDANTVAFADLEGMELTELAQAALDLASVRTARGDFRGGEVAGGEAASVARLFFEQKNTARLPDQDGTDYAVLSRNFQTASFRGHVQAGASGEGPLPDRRDALLRSAQFARQSSTDEALRHATNRSQRTDEALAALLTRRDRAVQRLRKVAEQERRRDEETPRGEPASSQAELDAVNAAIEEQYPWFADRFTFSAVSLAKLQNGLLLPNEAMLIYVRGPSRWVGVAVSKNVFKATVLARDPALIDADVAAVRASTDLTGGRGVPEFDAAAAARLHTDLIAPFTSMLNGVGDIVIVAEGALLGLPFAALPDETAGDSKWLSARFAISVAPSVGALAALRDAALRRPGQRPLLAFADPVLPARRTEPGAAAPLPYDAMGGTSGAGEDWTVCALQPLRDTVRMAEVALEALGGRRSDLLIGKEANEAALLALDERGELDQFRVVGFNTHGMKGRSPVGPIDGPEEPGLVLTPTPACGEGRGPPESDGLLTASEIQRLHFNAEWILLTACDTAAGVGGEEPLTGLAGAFFGAGARALLVSHWPAETVSTTLLMENLFDRERQVLSKARRLQEAQRVVRERFPHPAFWATFELVGDGR